MSAEDFKIKLLRDNLKRKEIICELEKSHIARASKDRVIALKALEKYKREKAKKMIKIKKAARSVKQFLADCKNQIVFIITHGKKRVGE